MGPRFRAFQGALLAFAFYGLSAAVLVGAELPTNPWRNRPEVPEPTDPVLVSDLDDSSAEAQFDFDFQIDTSADLNVAEQAQFQSGGGMRGGAGGRTAASPASLAGSGQRTPQSFTVRLARAPNMMGDFIGRGSSEITVQAPSSVQSFNSFEGEVLYEPFSSQGYGAEVNIVQRPVPGVGPTDFAQFALGGAFQSGDAAGIAFTSQQSVAALGSATTFDLNVTAADGSSNTDSQAQAFYQQAANTYLATPGSDPQNFLEQQKAAIIAQQGNGTFTPISGQNNTIAFQNAQATLNSTPLPDPSGPAQPNPIGGNPAPNVAQGELYYLSSEYLVSYADQIFTPDPVTLLLPSPAAADIVGRVRIQDNNSPLPKDRVFFDYNYFHNVPLTPTGTDVNRFAPGFEKTFWDRQASLEVRVPMALTLDSSVVTDGITDDSSTEFGNLGFVVKFLLSSSETTAWAAGMGVSAPTADDLDVGMADGTQLVRVDNDSTHVLPYLAMLYTPQSSNWYVQSFLTFDFDTVGSDVFANVNGTGLERIGTWNDQHLATLSVATGSWFYENLAQGSLFRRIGWQAEAHYTETLNDADSVVAGNFRIGNPNSELSLVNGTFGLNFQIGQTILTTGYSVPFTTDDEVFDGELRAFVNRYF